MIYTFFIFLLWAFGAALLFFVTRKMFAQESRAELVPPLLFSVFVCSVGNFFLYTKTNEAFDFIGSIIVYTIVLYLLWDNSPEPVEEPKEEPPHDDRTVEQKIEELLKQNKR